MLFFAIMPVIGMRVVVSTNIITTCLSAITTNNPIRSLCVWAAVGRGSGDSDVAERRTSHSKSASAAEPYEISEYEVAAPRNGYALQLLFAHAAPSFLFVFSLQTPCSARLVWT
jgi:hypothetical protein